MNFVISEDAQVSMIEQPSRFISRAGLSLDRLLARLLIKDSPVTARCATPTMIVCADCSGEATNPRKTLLSDEGRCFECGGGAYVLAAKMFARRV
jgi:hypothetical protein